MDSNAPKANDWPDILEALHHLANTMTVRSHYAEGHPAIARADTAAADGFARVLERIPELVVALIDNEFVIGERPLPDLRARLHVVADAMLRHEIECFVFQRGMQPGEASFLGRMLARPADVPGKVREQAQAGLTHVLLRFAELRSDQAWARAGQHGRSFAPAIAEILASIVRAVATDKPLDKKAVVALASEIVDAVESRMFTLESHAYSGPDLDEAGRHAANVAAASAALALASDVPREVAIDVAAAAMLHDVGHLLLPPEVRCIPEPLLEERQRPLFRNHTFAGASTLLGAGCPPLWVAAALEHHRGVDGGGYPVLESKAAPHPLVRMIALANYFDRRRTLLSGRGADDPDEALRRAVTLEERYFGKGLVETFLRALGAFPPGTTVALSTREVALVTHANPSDPWRPQVRLITGPNAGKRVDLKELGAVEGRHYASIVRAVPPPLLRPEDVAAKPAVAPKKVEAPEPDEPTPAEIAVVPRAPAIAPPTLSASERARAELADMGGVLDALLTIKTDDLAPSIRPMSASFVPGPPSARPQPAPAAPVVSITPPVAPPPPPPTPARRIESLASVPRLVVPMQTLALDHRAGFILSFVDGRTSIEEIVDVSGVPTEEVVRVLEELFAQGALAVS